ncbi:DUF2975 domain-containing protein [uncultured Ezakiella sp.]|uniref:DUF2975 domain-containing protein n=1 Tax=uncultured Ezakiella sp. TaxID=1637529 RepID=UPI0025D50319|nr:DUF2975 domain-containing protein [uncultured Ezakiella sp.]
MEIKKLSKLLKFILTGLFVLGLIVYIFIIPLIGKTIVEANPELSNWYLPWLIFLSLTSIPVLLGLFYSSKISKNISYDLAFIEENSKYLKYISRLAFIDSVFFFLGNIVMLLLNMNHPSVLILSILISFFGLSLYVIFSILSCFVSKSADLQSENDLTI